MRVFFDFSELCGRIIARYGNYAKFAETIGMSRAQLSERLGNKRPFKPEEVYLICSAEVLDIPADEIGKFFYTQKV